MKSFYALSAIALLIGCSGQSGFVLDPHPQVEPYVDMSDYEHFTGTVSLDGTYEYFEDGNACFEPSITSSRQLPREGEDKRICFSNEDEALSQFGIKDAIQSIDVKTICGVSGQATITVSDLWTGEGPATRWYTAKLIKVARLHPYARVRCDG
jgi:hypothetical protein